MIRIVIPRPIQSQNAFHYRHWRKYTQDRNNWLLYLRYYLPPRYAPPSHHVRLTIISHRTRFLDDANLRGGAKAIPDSLKRLNYLRDDSIKWMHCDYEQRKCKQTEQRTEIVIHNLEDT